MCIVISVIASASGPAPAASAHKARALEEMVERTESDFAQLVGHGFGGAVDQLAHVVQALGATPVLRRAGSRRIESRRRAP